jgi:serine/threonine protein kinase
MTNRLLAHPDIPGLTYLHDLGHGGFADVYLYQSQSPNRKVAVKILRQADLSDKRVQRLTDEANAMARLEHPYIVRVYRVGRTDDGRQFIEMAYVPNESLSAAVKRGRFAVAHVLKLGIQLAAAIETAHRANLIHRDIKPANILTDQYGDPALTDFGIASTLQADEDDEDSGLSVPWAPPEVMFGLSQPDQRSDIYSLAATLWYLLVGRAPFEVPDGDNGETAMMARTREWPPPQTGRGDVPQSLERLLQAALSKDPKHRPKSAADFARALLTIESELRLTPTPLKLVDLAPAAPTLAPDLSEDRTRRQTTRPVAPAEAPQVGQVDPRAQDATIRKSVAPVFDRPTEVKARVSETDEPVAAPVPGRPKGLVIGLVVAVAIVIGVAWWFLSGLGAQVTETAPSITAQAPDLGLTGPPGPVTIAGTRDGESVTFTWEYEGARPDDTYQVRLPDESVTAVRQPSYEAKALAETPFCIAVKVFRIDGSGASSTWSTEGCA